MRIQIEMELPDSCDPSTILEQAQALAVDLAAMELEDDEDFDEEAVAALVNVQMAPYRQVDVE